MLDRNASAAGHSAEQGELLRCGWRFQDDPPPVGYHVERFEPGDGLHGGLAVGGREIGSLAVGLLVARHELWPVAAEDRHEMLACPVLEVEHSGPEPGGAR